jgi:hypothetical protein
LNIADARVHAQIRPEGVFVRETLDLAAYRQAVNHDVRVHIAMESARRHWSEAIKIPLEDESTQNRVPKAEDLQLFPGGC